MDRTLKSLSLLLSYPTEELQAAVPAIMEAVRQEHALPIGETVTLAALAEDIAECGIYEAQERYVYLFDRTRSLSLHLFEHVHGESRDRGQAMVDLKDTYGERGFDIDAREMPDYLPLFLEFLSLLPTGEARELLGQTAHITVALKERLERKGSIYAAAFAALQQLGLQPDPAAVDELRKTPADDPDDLAALDRIWEEEAVTFGGNAGENACGPDRLRMQMRAAARRPADAASSANA